MTEKPEKKAVECVGSLLVPQEELKDLSESLQHQREEKEQQHASKAEESHTKEESTAGLVRRITKKMMEPMTDEQLQEMEDWTSYEW